jgi:esterase/lipase
MIEMDQELFQISSRRGTILHATWFRISNTTKSSVIVILAHGFSGDQSEWGRFTKLAFELNQIGMDVISFDFCGSGKNDREIMTLDKWIQDLEDVYHWVDEQNYEKISVIGLSFGGLTTLSADLPKILCAVFWAPAFYVSRLISPFLQFLMQIMTWLHFPPIKRYSINNEPVWMDASFKKSIDKVNVNEKLHSFQIPALIIQGTQDDQVPIQWNREAFLHFPQNSIHEMVEVEGATHDFDGDHLTQFIQKSIEFLQKNMKN